MSLWTFNLCATEVIAEGFALKAPISVSLDFSEGDYLLISASQSHANYFLELTDKINNRAIRKVNISADYALDEIFLVHISDCEKCIISLNPVELIDTNSPYKMSMQSIDISDDPLISVLKKLTSVGTYLSNAYEVQNTNREILLEKSKEQLNVILESKNQFWRHHTLTLLAENLLLNGEHEERKEILSTILNETDEEDSNTNLFFRATALTEYAKYEKNQNRVQKMYDSIIKIGQELNDQRITGLGKNEKAVNLVTNAIYDEALILLSEAKLAFTQTNRWRDLNLPLHNLSWAAQRAGKLPESLAHATQQLLIAETYDDKESHVSALYNFAMTYGLMGERFIADDFLDRAINVNAQSSSSTDSTRAYLLREKTQMFLKYGAFESARDYAAIAKEEFDTLGHPTGSADINYLEGQIAFAMQNYELAEEKFKQVIKFDRENNRLPQEGSHLLRLAHLKLFQKEYIKASQYQSQAFTVLSETKHYLGLARAFSQAAELLHHLGANLEAKKLLDRTSAFVELYSQEHDKALLAYRKALIAIGVGDHEVAKQSLESARKLVEESLPKIRQVDLRQSYLALQKSIFELNIKVMLSSNGNNLSGPLALAEAYKARTLAEQINSIQRNNRYSADRLDQQRQSILDKITKNAVSLHANKQQNDNYESLLFETRELGQRLKKIELQIADSHDEPPKYSQPVIDNTIPTPQTNELIAYYFIGNNSWLWVMADQNIYVYDLPSEKVISDLINNFLTLINTSPKVRQNTTAWQQSSAISDLSEVLLSPLTKHLKNSNIDLITIIPDGPLHGLPFSPLRLSSSTVPIIEDYAISYAPSLLIHSYLNQNIKKIESVTNTSLLVVADPVSNSNSEMNFTDLPFSKHEALAIKSLSDNQATLLLSENANKDELLKELSDSHTILHIATHGLLNKNEPSLSGLALSPSSTGENQLWLSPEISNSNISANLVVLSACESSIGKNISGEGLFSLSRAFIEGGANQVIGSLWNVQDQSTSMLFENFYTYLFKHGLGVAEALQKAQLAIYSNSTNDWSDPYYWAGFQLLGGGANQTYAIKQ